MLSRQITRAEIFFRSELVMTHYKTRGVTQMQPLKALLELLGDLVAEPRLARGNALDPKPFSIRLGSGGGR
jgi:hypothetical protein